MKSLITLLLVFKTFLFFAQNNVDWSENIEIKFENFQSNSKQIGEINNNSLRSGVTIEFFFKMSNLEFMMTKNFNNKVNCFFQKDVAMIVAQDNEVAEDMVGFSNYEFDLAEVYARKIRQQLFVNKGAFSDHSFFKPIYDQLMKEFYEKVNEAYKITETGKNKVLLLELHQQVQNQMIELNDYCKTCKPPRKKKKLFILSYNDRPFSC